MTRLLKCAICAFFLLSATQSVYADELGRGGSIEDTPVPPKGSVDAQSVCRELAPGGSESVSEEPIHSPTHVARRYRVTRSLENTNLYIAEVNLGFILTQSRAEQLYGHTGHEDSVLFRAQNDEQRAAFINRARYCFESMEGRLRSPNGVQLNLKVSSNNSTVSQSLVAIEPNEIRSHSGGWAGRLSCATIIHETLHLLGLVDGYRETGRTVTARAQAKRPPLAEGVIPSRYMYDCRRVEPDTSVMSKHQNALSLRYDMIFCPVSSAGERPRGFKRESSPVRCPNGAAPTYSFSNINRVHFLRRIGNYSAPAARTPAPKGVVNNTPYNGANYFYYEYNSIVPTLTNQQMSFITQPGCLSASSDYISCSQNAYRTRTLQGCHEVPNCD